MDNKRLSDQLTVSLAEVNASIEAECAKPSPSLQTMLSLAHAKALIQADLIKALDARVKYLENMSKTA